MRLVLEVEPSFLACRDEPDPPGFVTGFVLGTLRSAGLTVSAIAEPVVWTEEAVEAIEAASAEAIAAIRARMAADADSLLDDIAGAAAAQPADPAVEDADRIVVRTPLLPPLTDGLFRCPVPGCTYTSDRQNGLSNHRRSHVPVVCDLCGGGYTEASIGAHRWHCQKRIDARTAAGPPPEPPDDPPAPPLPEPAPEPQRTPEPLVPPRTPQPEPMPFERSRLTEADRERIRQRSADGV